MRMSSRVLPLIICAAAFACADSEALTETLTCEVLASPDFCWTIEVADAHTCIHPSLSGGVFSADRTECTYIDGTRVQFHQVVPTDFSAGDDYLWNFSIVDASGTECMRYDQSERTFTMVSPGGTIEYRRSGAIGIDVECPDGEVLHTDDVLNLLDCEQEDAVIPGYSFVSNAGSVAWSLRGAPEGSGNLWSCDPP